jgi:hypothetical protein
MRIVCPRGTVNRIAGPPHQNIIGGILEDIMRWPIFPRSACRIMKIVTERGDSATSWAKTQYSKHVDILPLRLIVDKSIDQVMSIGLLARPDRATEQMVSVDGRLSKPLILHNIYTDRTKCFRGGSGSQSGVSPKSWRQLK